MSTTSNNNTNGSINFNLIPDARELQRAVLSGMYYFYCFKNKLHQVNVPLAKKTQFIFGSKIVLFLSKNQILLSKLNYRES